MDWSRSWGLIGYIQADRSPVITCAPPQAFWPRLSSRPKPLRMQLRQLPALMRSTSATLAFCATASKRMSMASRSLRACALPIRLYALQPRAMRGSIHASRTVFVAGPGVHETTVTQPGLFRAYLTEQIRLLIENHGVPVEIGESSEPIPVHFAYRRDMNLEAAASAGRKLRVDRPLRDVFDTPDLAAMDDAIANGTLQRLSGAPEPLALFRAARIDYSLYRLYHYTGTDPEYFQNFVIFTNYQFYVDAFARLGHEHVASGHSSSDAFVEPGNVITRHFNVRNQYARLCFTRAL